MDVKPGDYVVVEIEKSTGMTLIGRPIALTTLTQFSNNMKTFLDPSFEIASSSPGTSPLFFGKDATGEV